MILLCLFWRESVDVYWLVKRLNIKLVQMNKFKFLQTHAGTVCRILSNDLC